MLRFGNILSLVFVLASFSVNAIGRDAVVVELKTGQRIRASAIQVDAMSPDQVQLTAIRNQMQIRRLVSWARIRRVAASTEILENLSIPSNIEVVDPEQSGSFHELSLTIPSEGMESNRKAIRSFFRHPPAPPVPDTEHYDSSVATPFAWSDHPLSPWSGNPLERCAFQWIAVPGIVVGIRDPNPLVPPISASQPARAVVDADPKELFISVRPFNRNGLADWNSLEVLVQGRTAAGTVVPVRGSLKCCLWGRRAKLVRAYAEIYFEEPRELVILGQWSQFLDGDEMDANGIQKIVLALPPRLSEYSLDTSQFGLVTAELDIPGQGRLATSSEPVELRRSGPVRSRSVVDFGTSILPRESVSEGAFDAGNWPAPLSDLRPDSRRFTVQP